MKEVKSPKKPLIYYYGVVLLLLLVFGGWCVFWLVSLLCEKAGGRHYLRLCHWALFLVLFGLVLGGMLG